MSTNDELLRFAKRLIGDETAAGDARLEEIESRLMPEGYSWPREADGTPVIPDENVEFPVRDASPYTMKVDAVAFTKNGCELHDETRTLPVEYGYGEAVERAAPDMSNVELTMDETNLSRSVDPAQQSAEQGFGQTQRTMSWSRYEA